jgi:redox-sensitive bicupin YhaK (pirin superfamily)
MVITIRHELEKQQALVEPCEVGDPAAMQRRTFLVHGLASIGALATMGSGRSGGSQFQAVHGSNAQVPTMQTMPLTIRRAAERGHARHGWLDSHHTFSFADYHDPAHMGFRSLRVINEDRVQAGRGFGTHPHRDMEIFSYVLAGSLQHQDSMGNGRVLAPGEIQLMSAGTGVTHSEKNPSEREGLHFLQVWIQPDRRGLRPGYTEWKPDPAAAQAKDVVVISPDGRNGSAVIHQDAIVRRLRLDAGDSVSHVVAPGRGMWLQLIRGRLRTGDQDVHPGDGASTETAGTLSLLAAEPVEALLFDLG